MQGQLEGLEDDEGIRVTIRLGWWPNPGSWHVSRVTELERWDSAEMEDANVYPFIWNEDAYTVEALEALEVAFSQIKEYRNAALAKGPFPA